MENVENVNVTDEMVEIVPDQVATVEEPKKGLTGGQKAVGLGIIGLAIFGIVELVMHAIRGVKGLVAKFKAKKEEAEPEKAADQPEVEVVEVDNETMDEIQKAK